MGIGGKGEESRRIGRERREEERENEAEKNIEKSGTQREEMKR